MKKLALTLSVLALAACGGGGGGGGGNNLTGNSSEKLEGIWKSSINEEAEGIDEIYFVFTSGGLLTIYDYAGDSYDNYANCYWIANAQFKSKGNDKYEISSFEAGDTSEKITATITVSGSFMTMKTEEDGTVYTERLTKSYLKESDLTPECDASSNSRSMQNTQKAPTSVLSAKPNTSLQ